MLPYPVASLNVIWGGIFGKSRRFRLLRCKQTLLLLRSREQVLGCITAGLSHNTILQVYCGLSKTPVTPARPSADAQYYAQRSPRESKP